MGSSTLRSSKSPLMPVAESMSFGYLNGVRYGASPSVDGKAGAAAAEVTMVATLRRKLRRVCMTDLSSYIVGMDRKLRWRVRNRDSARLCDRIGSRQFSRTH